VRTENFTKQGALSRRSRLVFYTRYTRPIWGGRFSRRRARTACKHAPSHIDATVNVHNHVEQKVLFQEAGEAKQEHVHILTKHMTPFFVQNTMT
jgi:hypothetical protein